MPFTSETPGTGKITNLGIFAHVDAGKTTVTEKLLLHCSRIRSAGSVDDGSTVSDHTDIERRRGISVFSSFADIEVGGIRINLLDTPGHVDFAGEAERSLLPLDAALVVISAVEGIQSHTENILLALERLSLPYIVFINKIDRAGSRAEEIFRELCTSFRRGFLLLNRPEKEGEKDCRILPCEDLYGNTCELLGSFDDEILESYLEERKIEPEKMAGALKDAVCACRAVPVLCGSAMFGVGIPELCEALGTYLPDASALGSGKLSGVIYKIEHDKVMGRLAHVRLFGGKLSARDSVTLHSPGDTGTMAESGERGGKISQIRRALGGKTTDVGEVSAGDIAVLCGLADARAGDFIGEVLHERHAELCSPFLQVSAMPEDPSKLTALVAALTELSAEEPYLHCRWEKSEREVVIRITGEIQLDIIKALLLERYGIAASFSAPSVVYRETPKKEAEGFEAYTMPKPCWAVVRLLLTPTVRGSGVVFDRGNVPNNQLFYRYQAHIEQSFRSCTEQGIYGWEVTDFKCTLIGGEHHTIHTHPLDFFVATPVAFLRGLTNAGSALLEPYLRVRVSAPDEYMGKIIGDVTKMRGEFDTPVLKNGKMLLEASLPVADSLDYPIRLASATSGKGALFSAFDSYRPCPDGFMKTCRRRGPDPLDRPKWILYNRGAMTEE